MAAHFIESDDESISENTNQSVKHHRTIKIENESKNERTFNIDGVVLSSEALCRAITNYKVESRKFIVGDIQMNCSRMGRQADDRWYKWTKEMMESIDRNEQIMRKAIVSHSHEELQSVCRDIGGRFWNLEISEEVDRLVSGIKVVENMLNSDTGIMTCWGIAKFNGVFVRKVLNYVSNSEKNSKNINILEYIEQKTKMWNEEKTRQENEKEKEQLYCSS